MQSPDTETQKGKTTPAHSPLDNGHTHNHSAHSAASPVKLLKHELKNWEAAFQKKNGRAPKKEDLLHHPEIARKYKQYSKLKRGAGSKGEAPPSTSRRSTGQRGRHIHLPLETSTLPTPTKRKSAAAQTPPEAAAPRLTPPRRAANGTKHHSKHHEKSNSGLGSSDSESDFGDVVEATPKKRRTDGLFPSARKAEPHLHTSDTLSPERSCSRALFAEACPKAGASSCAAWSTETAPPHSATVDAANETDWDPVAYVPPPSLLRPYPHSRPPSLPARPPQSPSSGSRTECSPLAAANTVLALPTQATPNSRCPGLVGSMRSLDLGLGTPSFKARAGRLVKTTSIPLSAFGAQFRGASQILSSQGHLSDGCDDLDPSRSAELEKMSDGELVIDDADNKPDSEQQTDSTAAAHGAKKKSTQKRSTRRVKLKPVYAEDSAASLPARAARSNSQNLVSDNFYKLRLRRSNRGARSTEERRAALYKRMVGKKGRSTAAASANPDTGRKSAAYGAEITGSEGQAGGYDFDPDMDAPSFECADEACMDGNASGCGEPDDGADCGEYRSKQLPKPSSAELRKIAGRLLSDFVAAGGSGHPCVCTVSSAFACGRSPHGYTPGAARKETHLDLRKILRHVWGHDEFRHGQMEAMKRILGARSTLLLLATGSGKSLAYQLPSLVLSSVFSGLTLVITPLISLMRDQIRHLPRGLQAICMSFESSSAAESSDIPSRLMSGQVQLLFISPERLASPRFQELITADGMPPVQLAVIDEAHCASEWSHNFRPAYFQVPRVLRALNVTCVLAMTGTATATLADSLCSMFGIDREHDVVRGEVVRDNIRLSVVPVEQEAMLRSKSCAREDTLVNILRTPDMAALSSVLVYVSTQANADRVAEYLTARSIPAQSYHAGKSAAERARIQAAFMRESNANPSQSGSARMEVPIRVLVATVAFGMGLNKSDIRAVIHFNLPRSMEAYVQEVGRAGRDGAPAQGILILATSSAGGSPAPQPAPQTALPNRRSVDAVLTRSWAYSDGVDIAAVRRLLHRLLPPEFMRTAIASACQAHAEGLPLESDRWRVSHTAVLSLQSLESDIDAGQAVAQTLISYLAMQEPDMIHVKPNTHRTCIVRFTRTELGRLAEGNAFFASLASYVSSQTVEHSSKRHRSGPSARILGSAKPGTSAAVDIFDFAKKLAMPPSDVASELYKWRARREIMLTWQDPSCVIQVSLDMSRFTSIEKGRDKGGHASDGQLAEVLAFSVDKHISDLAASVAQQNESMVRQSIQKADAIESTMLAAAQFVRETTKGPAPVDPGAVEAGKQRQNDFIQTSTRAYFSASQAERECLVRTLKTTIDITCPGVMDDRVYAELLGKRRAMSAGEVNALKADVKSRISKFVEQHCVQLTSGRAVARVFHGLSSPTCSSSQWMWCSEWGSLVSVDFDVIRQCAQEELVRVHCQASEAVEAE
ncbi:ATP-dependent DNA helicase [Martensiomyces pterosporus]|nr:ATP-dependent DNA helicase [Martensiomyces pterosporus]